MRGNAGRTDTLLYRGYHPSVVRVSSSAWEISKNFLCLCLPPPTPKNRALSQPLAIKRDSLGSCSVVNLISNMVLIAGINHSLCKQITSSSSSFQVCKALSNFRPFLFVHILEVCGFWGKQRSQSQKIFHFQPEISAFESSFLCMHKFFLFRSHLRRSRLINSEKKGKRKRDLRKA